MISEGKILQLKQAYYESEKRIEEIGKKQSSTIIELSEWLRKLIENIESTQERGKELENAAVSPRIKLMKKGVKLSKELKNFEMRVVKAFEEGNVSEDIGKRFAAITKSIKKNKLPLAKNEFEYFGEIVELGRRYESAKEELEKKDGILRREQGKVKKILEEIRELEKENIDLEKVQKHEEFLKNLEKLEESRRKYLCTLVSKPVVELFKDMEIYSLEEHPLPFLGEEKTEKLKEFFSENPKLEKYSVSQLCELFNYSEKKLSHIYPETSEFRRVVQSNREWFENVRDLERTTFLAVDDENEKVMSFYAERIDGAREIVEQIMQQRKEKNSYKKEYEKNRRIEERKKEFSKYSENELEKELKEIKHLLVMLHSKPEERKEEEKEEKKEKQGLLSKIESFFK